MAAPYPQDVQHSTAHTVAHTVAISQVDLILQGARARRLDCARLLERAGIAPALLDSPLSRVTQAQYAALVIRLTRATRDELWGLCDRPVPPGSFASGCRLLIHCKTLGEALRAGARYAHQVLPGFAPRLQVEGGVATLRIAASGRPDAAQAFAQRSFMFFAFGTSCWLVARRIPLLEVIYYQNPDPVRDYASRLFQAPVRAGQDWMGLRFESRWLDLPVVQTDESLRHLLRHAPGDLLLRYRDHSSLTERIRRMLRRHLHEELPSLEAVCADLAMTPQTLRRRLQREGNGFQSIKENLRRDVAVEYLARTDLPLDEIAGRLGYSEASTFLRAFKTWTGLTPGAYRTSQKGESRRRQQQAS